MRVSSRATSRAHGVDRVTGIDPSVNQLRVARERAGGPRVRPGRRRRAAVPGRARSTAWSRASCSSTSRAVDAAIAEVARVLAPGGMFLFLLNHPLLQAPGSGWIDDHILEEQYWRIGPYLVESLEDEEIAPGVHLPFVHRPMSRYVNTMAANGLLVDRMLEPAPPAGFPRPGGRVRRVRVDPTAAGPARAASLNWPSARRPGNADVPGMRRLARVLILVGIVGAVFGLAKLHAAHPRLRRSPTRAGSAGRSPTSACCCVAAYAVGLPSLPPSRNKLLVAAGGRRARRDPRCRS